MGGFYGILRRVAMITDGDDYRYLIELDRLTLANCRIEWEGGLLRIAGRIADCRRRLALCAAGDGCGRTVMKRLYEELEDAEAELVELIGDMVNMCRNAKIESLVHDMLTWHEAKPEVPYRWKYISLCMLRNPDRVVFDVDCCDKCGGERVSVYFRPPGWMRIDNCGPAGDVVICPRCHTRSFQAL